MVAMDAARDPHSEPERPALPVAPRRVRVLCGALFGIAALILAATAARSIKEQLPDFEYFYKAGAWLLEHGDLDRGYDKLVGGQIVRRGSIEWYLPFVSRVMTLFAWLPFHQAGAVWLLLNLVAMFTTVRLLGRHLSGLPPRDWPVTQLLPFVFLIVFWYWEFWLNQINNFTMLLMVGSFVCWQRGRRATAGLWLGLAVLLKLTPVLLVVWFALKRQFRTVGVALLTIIAAGPLSDAIAFAPARTVEMYRAWARRAVSQGSHRGLILSQREADWRNQSLSAVALRWLHPVNWNTHWDNDPRLSPQLPTKTLNVAQLPLPTIAGIVFAVAGLSLIGLLWLARHPAARLTVWQLRLEFALFMVAMLWLMPVVRRYHLIWALPAVSMLGACLHYSGFRRAWAGLAWAGLGGIVLAQMLLLPRSLGGDNFVEATGVFLAAVALLAVPVIAMLVKLARNPGALPADLLAPVHPAETRVRPNRGTGTPPPSLSANV